MTVRSIEISELGADNSDVRENQREPRILFVKCLLYIRSTT